MDHRMTMMSTVLDLTIHHVPEQVWKELFHRARMQTNHPILGLHIEPSMVRRNERALVETMLAKAMEADWGSHNGSGHWDRQNEHEIGLNECNR